MVRICNVKHRAPTLLQDSSEGEGKILSNHKYPTQQPKENKATGQLNCTVYKWPLFFSFFPQSPTSAHLDWTRAFTTPLSSSFSWNQSLGFGRMVASRHHVLQKPKSAFTRRASPNTYTTGKNIDNTSRLSPEFLSAPLLNRGKAFSKTS